MSRRRSANPTKAISVTLPTSLLDKLEDKLSYTESRSAWIAGAIRMRLEDSTAISEMPTHRLKVLLHNRVCGCYEHASCTKMIALGALISS